MPLEDRFPADLDHGVHAAFRAWQEARATLGHLRAQGPGAGQFAASPEVLAHFEAIRNQEALCDRLWATVTDAAEARAAENAGQGSASPLPIEEGPDAARHSFRLWASAERQAQAAERELLAAMHAEQPVTDEFLQSVRLNRANAHSLFSAALREMKQRAAALHHRNILQGPGNPNGSR